MFIFFELGALLFLLYIVGKIIYKKKITKHYTFLKVLTNFLVIMVSNALLMIVLSVILFAYFLLMPVSEEVVSNYKLPTVQILIGILIFIFITAILQFQIRKKIIKKYDFLKLDVEDYEICEYFIQWLTIYVVIYQFLFEGLSKIVNLIPELKEDYSQLFAVLLSPQNINFVIQPLLIATWVLVVMEKISLRNKLE